MHTSNPRQRTAATPSGSSSRRRHSNGQVVTSQLPAATGVCGVCGDRAAQAASWAPGCTSQVPKPGSLVSNITLNMPCWQHTGRTGSQCLGARDVMMCSPCGCCRSSLKITASSAPSRQRSATSAACGGSKQVTTTHQGSSVARSCSTQLAHSCQVQQGVHSARRHFSIPLQT